MQWYKEQWADTITSKFDDKLESIKDLTWLPWVGKNYNAFKVLIVAESHYVNTDEPQLVKEKKAEYMSDPLSTRKVMAEYPLHGYNAGWVNHAGRHNNPTIDNLSKVLCGSALLGESDLKRRSELWSRLAFMNFIQRPMWYSKTHGKERPVGNDRTIGWKATLGAIDILKPDLCIFAGLEASVWFDYYMQENNVCATRIESHDRIGRCAPRSSTLKIGNNKIDCRFIRHPGMYFSWQPWREFVFNGRGELRSKIAKL